MLQGDKLSLLSLKGFVPARTNIQEEKPQTQNALDFYFYLRFLEVNSLLYIQIENFETINSESSFRHYVSYSIRVITDHISFISKKRYSDFSLLFDCLAKRHQFECIFPKKARFQSKVSNELSTTRMNQLNKFINEILSCAKDNEIIVIEFLEFLGLKSEYEIHNLIDKLTDKKVQLNFQQSQFSLSYCLAHQMLKLNHRQEESLKYLHHIQSIILGVKKAKLRMQDLKEVFLGNNDITGLIQFALKSNNQLVGISFLKTIHKALNIEQCSYSQACKRLLESISPKKLRLHSEIFLQNPEFQQQYFTLIDLYLELRMASSQKISMKMIIKQLFDHSVKAKFDQWKYKQDNYGTIIRKSMSYNVQKSYPQSVRSQSSYIKSIYVKVIDDLVEADKDIDPLERFQLVNNQFIILHEYNDCCFEVSKDHKIVHIHLKIPKIKRELCGKFKNWEYNKLVQSHYQLDKNLSDSLSLSMKAPKKQSKIFKLLKSNEYCSLSSPQKNIEPQKPEESTKRSTETIDSERQQCGYFKVVYEPLKQDSNEHVRENGFYYSMEIIEKQQRSLVNISFRFNKNSVRYFESELINKTSILWDGILETLAQYYPQFDTKQQLEPISEKSENIEVQ